MAVETQADVKIEYPNYFTESLEQAEIRKLRDHVEFLVETFTQRDADQRIEINSLKARLEQADAMMHMQAAKLAYFQGVGQKGADEFAKSQVQ